MFSRKVCVCVCVCVCVSVCGVRESESACLFGMFKSGVCV